ncbi:MAG: Fn3-like domain-containing protein [Oscillospiraceae bacterium]|nr:MAG: Fn3-like domain-containing protein [Oscillospiraceae bacterium]
MPRRHTSLSDSTITLEADGKAVSGNITVPAGKTVSVTVTIKLGDAGRKYLDESFVNGMYVEGFVSLQATGKTKVTIGLPYLAFYGDWNDAPLFDYSEYELAESQKDTGVPAEDKLVASAASTKVIGMYYDDKYILSMGSYLYSMEESDVAIYPDPDKIALSMFDTAGQRTIYELYMVYAGLLRGAAYMDIEITDDATGDVVYKEVKENVSKSYAAGGSNRGSAIMMEIKAQDWGLINNSKYRVHLKGQLDYPGGENPDRSTFDFTFTIDYEAPQVLDYRIRYDSYTENKQTKYRIYMDVDVYDNQYVQDLMPCYIRDTKDGKTLTLATQYPIPVYGEKGTTSTVSFEITDIYEEYVKTGKLYLVVEDYAMNQTSYLVQTGSGAGRADQRDAEGGRVPLPRAEHGNRNRCPRNIRGGDRGGGADRHR